MVNLHNLIENSATDFLKVSAVRAAYQADMQLKEKECAECKCPNCGLTNREAARSKRNKNTEVRRIKTRGMKYYQPEDDGYQYEPDDLPPSSGSVTLEK